MFNPSILQNNKLQMISTLGLYAFYILLFFNVILFHGSSWNLIKIVLICAVLCTIQLKKIILNHYIVFFSCSAFVFISLNEFLLQPSILIDNSDIDKHLNSIALQYIYVLPLIFIPTIIKASNIKSKIFYLIILAASIFSFIFNSYWNIVLNFDRNLLASRFTLLILYDYCAIALGLVALIYAIQLKNKYAYLFIILCLLNITTIILHGSRGAWLGLPVALFFIFISFYKTHRKNTIYALTLSILLSVLLMYTPNSPVSKRIDNFHQDTSLIEENNYHSSVGNRVALWSFSIENFKESPITGVGIKQFRENICELKRQNVIPDCNPHAHNIFLQELAAHGLMGLLAVLFLFLMPFIYFVKSWIRFNHPEIKILSVSGITFITYIAICGLTDYYFFFSYPTLLFFVIILSLMGFIEKKSSDLK